MNKKYTTLAAFVFLILFSLSSFSQSCANYGVTRTTGITYSSMGSSGNVIPYWLGQIANQNDDNRSSPVPIGFDFWYLGVRYTNVSISINGFIDFSTTTYDGNWPVGDPAPTPPGYAICGTLTSYREGGSTMFNVPCGSGVPPNSYDGTYWALAPFYCDIWASNGSTVVANSIKYKTAGIAPNRIFTVEYFNMDDWASAAISDYNFQVKLYETTGAIDFQYGVMNQSAGAVPYACGINGRIQTNPPAASELLSQQADNSASFGNAVTPLHNAAPVSNSKIVFTPPVPANPSTPLTFTAVGNTSMTLNWADWATNEDGYVIYISTDGVNYSFYTQTAANAISYAASSLYGTTYWWKVYAVTEGCLSTPVAGSQATLPAGNFISVTTGNWSNGATWLAGTVPTIGDNVIIDNGHVVTMDGSYSCSNLTIGQGTSGTLLIGNSTTGQSVNVLGDIIVNNGAVFTPNPAFAATHSLNLSGNLTNNSIIDFRPNPTSLLNISFIKNGNQTISGTGATNNYNNIVLNMGSSITDILEVTSTNFAAASNFLTMNNGTFKFSVPVNPVVLDIFTAATTIPNTCGLWMNSPNSTMYAHSTLTFRGSLTCSAGILNVGDNADEALMSNGALLSITGGTVNVSGRLDRPSYVAITNFFMSGGNLNLNTVGSTSTTNSPFMVDVPGSSFTMSGGTIFIKNAGGTGTQNLGYNNTGCLSNYLVTGGTLQIGTTGTLAAQTMNILTNIPIGNLTIDTTSSPTGKLITYPLTVVQHVNTKVNGTFNANNLNIIVGGNWINNGTYLTGNNTVTFNGVGTVSGASITTANSGFNHVIITGTLTGHANTMNVKGNWTNDGVFNHNNGTVLFYNNSAQSISSTALTAQTFYNVVVAKSGNTLTVTAPTVTITMNNDFTNTSGNFAAPPTTNVDRNVLISSGTVTAGANIFVKGDWTRNGGTFTPGLNRVTFNGSVAQQINGTVSTHTFYNLDVAKTGGTLLNTGGSATTINTQDFTETSDNYTAPATMNINGNYLLTLGTYTANSNTNVKGNWTYNGGTFTPNLGRVTFNSSANQQTIGGTLSTRFDNLTFNNTFVTALPQLIFGNNENVNLNLNMTAAKVNLAGFKLILGTGPLTATVGTLNCTPSITNFLYGGDFTRWYRTNTVANGNVAGLFPMGEINTPYYASLYISAPSSAPTSGGTINCNYTDPATTTAVSFLDAGTPLQVRNNEIWNVTTANGLAGGTYNMRADRTFVSGAVGAITDLRLTLFGSVVGTAGVNAGTVTIPQVNRTALTMANLTNSFYISSINLLASPLPIELLKFTATKCNNDVCLDWTTATETNNDYFTVEKSTDGIYFEEVSVVDGAGNSTTVLNYSSLDDEPYQGVSYYRLKQTDFNGSISYSNVEEINFNGNTADFSLNVYPNPNDGSAFNLMVNANKGEEVLVVVYDATGKETYSKVIITNDSGENIYAIDPSNKLAAGMYLIIATSKQSMFSKKMIVK
jgi:Secretion system C-terminal sorting domain